MPFALVRPSRPSRKNSSPRHRNRTRPSRTSKRSSWRRCMCSAARNAAGLSSGHPSAERPASSRATGTRNGEQET